MKALALQAPGDPSKHAEFLLPIERQKIIINSDILLFHRENDQPALRQQRPCQPM